MSSRDSNLFIFASALTPCLVDSTFPKGYSHSVDSVLLTKLPSLAIDTCGHVAM